MEAENVVQGLEANKKEYDVACKQIDQLNAQPPTPGDDYDTALENHNRVLSSLQSQKLHLESEWYGSAVCKLLHHGEVTNK